MKCRDLQGKFPRLPLGVGAIILAIQFGCSTFSGFYRLPTEERNHYTQIADRMSLDQRMAYLHLETPEERAAYLVKLGLAEKSRSTRVSQEVPQPQPAVERILPAPGSKVAVAKPNPPEQPQPATKSAPVLLQHEIEALQKEKQKSLEEKSAKVTAGPANALPFERTGDPVVDVLKLLELYEAGKITHDQFEHEKELILSASP